MKESYYPKSGDSNLKESGVDPAHLQSVLTTLTVDVKKLGQKQNKGKRLTAGLVVLLVLVLAATAVLVVEYVHFKNDDVNPPSPDPTVPFLLDQDSLNMDKAQYKWVKESEFTNKDFEKAVSSEDYLLIQVDNDVNKRIDVYSPEKKKIVANGTPTSRVAKDEVLQFYGTKNFVVTDVFSPRLNYTTVFNISEESDEQSNGDAFMVNTGTRYSALKNENEIFITHNDSAGQMYLSLIQVYPTVKNISSASIKINATYQHKMIHNKQAKQVIIVTLDTQNKHTSVTRYDDKSLYEIIGEYVYFEDGIFMTDLYFADVQTLIIRDISGDTHTVNLNNYVIGLMPKNPYPEIYIEPYWYSQPTNDTLYVHDKHGSKYLFDLGHAIQFMGQSQNHLIFISTPADCKGSKKCHTFWQFDKDHTNKVIEALHGRFNTDSDSNQLFLTQ